MNPTQPMSNFMGRHPALPPTNNLLQLPNNSGKRKMKLMRSLSKSKIPSDMAQDTTPIVKQEEHEFSEKDHNIPQSSIKDTLTGDDKNTYKDMWEGSSTVMSILGCLQDVLPKLPNEPYGVRVNFPNLVEFAGSQVKKYPVTAKDTVRSLLQQICNKFQVDVTKFTLTTLSGISLSPSSTFISLGVGTLFHTWEVVLVPSPVGETTVKVDASNVVDLSSKYPLEHTGLKVLVGLLFPSGSVEFGSRLRGMQKLDLFVPIGKMFADLCRQRFEISDVSRFTLATMDGIALHPDCVLADYGLGIRFSAWDLRVQRKSESSTPPFLHHHSLMWLFIPEAWANSTAAPLALNSSTTKPSLSREVIEAVISLDSKCTNAEANSERAKQDIAAMTGNSESDKNTITDLRAQVDDLVEEVHSLSTSKSLFMEMSDILKQDVEAFSQEKDMWKKEKERLQAYFDTVVIDLEARVAKLEEENDQLKRKGAAQELMGELVQLRAKYKEAVEGHEKELQRVMRENLVQRRKLVQEVEDKILMISQEKGQIAVEWNRLRSEKTSQLEDLRRESERINRERFSIEQEFNIREAKLRRDFEVQLDEMRRGPRKRSSSFEADDTTNWAEHKHEVEKKLDTILEEQVTWKSQLTGAQQENEKSKKDLDEAAKRYKEETELMRKQLENLRIEGEQQMKKLLQSHREEGEQQMQQFLQHQKEETDKQKHEITKLQSDLDETTCLLKKAEEDNGKLQQQVDTDRKQAGEDKKQWTLIKSEAEKAQKQVDKLKGDAERQQKQAELVHRRHKEEIENIQRELEKARDYKQRAVKEEVKQAEVNAKVVEIEELKKNLREKETEVESVKQKIGTLDKHVEELEKQHNQDLQQLKQNEEKHSQLLQQHQQSMQLGNDATLQQQQKYEQLMEEFKTKLEAVQKQHQAQLASADKQHELHVSSLTNKYEQQLTSSQQQYEDKLAKLQQQLEDNEHKHKTELNATSEQITQLKQTTEQQTSQTHLKEGKTQLELATLRQSISDSQKEFTKELETAKQKLSELEQQHTSEMNKLTGQHAEQQEQQKALHETEVSNIQKSHEASVKEYEIRLTSLQQQHSQNNTTTETNFTNTIQELQQQIVQLKNEVVTSAKQKQDIIDQHNKQISDLTNSHAQELSRFESTTQNQQTEQQKLTEKHQHQLESQQKALQEMQLSNEETQKQRDELASLQIQHATTLEDLQIQLSELQTEYKQLKHEREELLQELKTKEEELTDMKQEHQTTQHGHLESASELTKKVTFLTAQLDEERKQFKEDKQVWLTERDSLVKLNQSNGDDAIDPSSNKKALKKTGSEMSLAVKKQSKYAALHTDRTDRDKDTRGTTAMLIAKRLCDVERMLNIKLDEEGTETVGDDKEGVLKVLRRIDTIRHTLARNKQIKELKSPTKDKSPAPSRKNLSPTKTQGETLLDTSAAAPTTVLTDHRAEFRLASDLKTAKEVNQEITAQLGVVKRQLSDMHKHHERTISKLKEEHTWSIDHLKRSFEKDKEILRSQLEVDIRKQVEDSLKPAWKVDKD